LHTKDIIEQLEIPPGILFYPCCGSDTLEPLELFYKKIVDFHFCDNHNIGLPHLKPYHDLIRPAPIHTFNASLDVTLIKTTRNGDVYQETYYHPVGHECKVHAHIDDAIKVFNELDDFAVFFYRGDSMTGLGSGITWFGPDLFPLLVDKMVDGGYIITDGSNPDANQLDNEWMELYRHSHWNYPDLLPGEHPNNFIYKGMSFICVGSIGERYGDVYVWKILK
jgi:hypothetical protein